MHFFGKKIRVEWSKERSLLLVCFGISLLIWTVMKLSGEFKTTRSVQLKYDLPDMMEFVEQPPENLIATLRGSGLSLIGNFIRNPNPSIKIDLQDKVGRNIERYELLSSTRDVFKVEVTDLDRNYLKLEIDSMFRKKVPVELVSGLRFAPDCFPLNGVQLFPDSVFISGTPDQLEEIFSVKTEKLTSKPLFESWSKNVKIISPKPGVIRVSPEVVTANVEVEQFTEKKLELSIALPETEDSLQLIPASVEARCVVPLSQFARLNPSDFKVIVGIEDSKDFASQNMAPLKIERSPEWVRSVELTPPAVEYLIVQ